MIGLVDIALYLLIAFIIHAVLGKVAGRTGRSSPIVAKAAVVLALTWPLWGELALLLIVIYALYRGVR